MQPTTPEMHLYEYAILRVVPRVEREEFLNIGVVLYCAGGNFLRVKYTEDFTRLSALAPAFDTDELLKYLHSFERICAGRREGGVIGQLPVSSRFRWLTASRSTILQCSKVHPGYCADPETKLSMLFEQQVG